MNHSLYIAMVVGPKYKLNFIEYALWEMYLSEKGVGVVSSLKNAIYALYDEYKLKLTPQSETRDMSEVSIPSVVESVRKEKS